MQIVRWRCYRSRNTPRCPISWKSVVESLGPHKRWRARGDLIVARDPRRGSSHVVEDGVVGRVEKNGGKNRSVECVGAGSMKSAKWRREEGDRNGEGREAIEEGDEGAIEGSGRMTRRKVSIGGTKKKEEEKKEERERREEGKKIEAAVGIESLSGSRMPRVKIKERFARRSCYSSRFFSLFSFVPRMKFHCIEFCPGVCISLADYRWYRYCDINLSMKPLWLYRIRGSLKVIRFVMQNCSFCKKKENDRYGCVSVYKYLVIRIVSFFFFPFETCHWIFVHFFESFGMIEV